MSQLKNLFEEYKIPDKEMEELEKTFTESEGEQDVPNPETTPPTPESEESGDPSKDEGNAEQSSDTPPQAETPSATEKTPEITEEKPTPFHEHPDWKKMQERVEAAERKAEEAERNARKASDGPDPYPELKTPQEIAEKILREKQASGWQPKDALELTSEFDKAKEVATTIVKKREDEQLAETTRLLNQEYVKAGVTTPEDQKKVETLLQTWLNEGVKIDFKSVSIAAEQLKLKGEIGQPITPTTPDLPIQNTETERDKQTKAQTEVNKKITRKKSAGGESGGSKPSYKYLANTDLDSIIMDQAEKLQ